MSKYKRIKHKIGHIKDNTSDKELYGILDKILGDSDLKQVSGIFKNSFAEQTRDYFKKYNRFTDRQREALIKTLEVYSDNLVRSRLV